MTGQDRGELQFAAVIGAVLGGVIGYLLSHTVESGGWLKILVWAFIGAIVVAGMVFCGRISAASDASHARVSGTSSFQF
jgi:high-affinity Fe2+/Pb2+ permease